MSAVVRVLDAPARPPRFVLKRGTCVVGSAEGADILVSEPTVSRAHVELALVPEGVSVRDLGSRNGTFYLGQRIEKMVLSLGGRVRVGAATVAVEADNDALVGLEASGASSYRGLVGTSQPMRRLYAMLERLEGSLATVLVQGESGVGKELVARALHEGSRVAAGPFIPLNCGALPRETLTSELFGHKRGAFTGATDARRGAFESADGGTLFLDEIGELPLEVQPTLLRALELGEIRPLGDDHAKRVRVRLVAATNRDLEAEVAAGRFRQDLFFRLAVVRLKVPPLRERPEDIEALAACFAERLGLSALPPAVLEALKGRAWAGNAREVFNAVQSYAALGFLPEATRAAAGSLDDHLRALVDPRAPYADQKDALVERFTKVYLESLMAMAGGNQSEASRVSGLSRGYLGRVLAKYGLARGGDEGAGER
ncbi:MAG: sigma 54-dependent Fis family transcriptional regulator [Polyangiaceae bacterium]|nr:sigma 54-dependent Fis family transcriptional regulator [Polyangiaceae bacterium]